jgi:hypothetical protein
MRAGDRCAYRSEMLSEGSWTTIQIPKSAQGVKSLKN